MTDIYPSNATDYETDPTKVREDILKLAESLFGTITPEQVKKLDETLLYEGPKAAQEIADALVATLIRKNTPKAEEQRDLEEDERHRRNAHRTAPKKLIRPDPGETRGRG